MNGIQKKLAIGALGLTSLMGGCDNATDTFYKVAGREPPRHSTQIHNHENKSLEDLSNSELLSIAGRISTEYDSLIKGRENENGRQRTIAATNELRRVKPLSRSAGRAAGSISEIIEDSKRRRGYTSRSDMRRAVEYTILAGAQTVDMLSRREEVMQLPVEELKKRDQNIDYAIDSVMDGDITPEDRENLINKVALGKGVLGASAGNYRFNGRNIPLRIVTNYGR